MHSWKRMRRRSALGLSAVLSGMAIAACSPAVEQMAAPSAGNSAAVPEAATSESAGDMAQKVAAEVPQAPPQLIKTAEISLTVDSVPQQIERATTIARQQQGDLVGLQDQTPQSERDRHTATLQLRVPQRNLDATLKAMATLGTVERQSIAAQDVSTQLVDFQARLKNLQNTEAMLLKIMNRSGGVGDVLKVAQELSNVRNEIEQINAQLKNLQNQVAYSVVTVNLAEAIATIPQQSPLGTQISDTWQQATHSVGEFTVGLMKLLLWLLVYSPYWGGAIAVVLLLRRLRRTTVLQTPHNPDPPTQNQA